MKEKEWPHSQAMKKGKAIAARRAKAFEEQEKWLQ